MGLVPGNRVLLHGPNTPELVACWLGVLMAGGVAVATMPLLRAGELTKVIAKAQVTHALPPTAWPPRSRRRAPGSRCCARCWSSARSSGSRRRRTAAPSRSTPPPTTSR